MLRTGNDKKTEEGGYIRPPLFDVYLYLYHYPVQCCYIVFVTTESSSIPWSTSRCHQ